MRTTLTLDDDLFKVASQRAKLRGLSLGKVVSDLARKGLTVSAPMREECGFTVFDLPKGSPTVTSKDIRRLEAEGY